MKYGKISKSLLIFDKAIWQRDDFAIMTDGPIDMSYHSTSGQTGKKILTALAIGDKADMFNRKSDDYNKKIIQTRLLAAGIADNIMQSELKSMVLGMSLSKVASQSIQVVHIMLKKFSRSLTIEFFLRGNI